jgi:hypothetical protein
VVAAYCAVDARVPPTVTVVVELANVYGNVGSA